MRKTIVLCMLIVCTQLLTAQDTTIQVYYQPEWSILDVPYHVQAAKAVSNQAGCPNCNASVSDYFVAYLNPNMPQSLQLSTSFYTGLHWLTKKAFSYIKYPWLRIPLQNTTLVVVDYWTSYMPLGFTWTHEEFHRAVLTHHYINSFDDIYTFPFGEELIAVHSISDENLIRFKAEDFAGFARMSSAGQEGEYMLIRNLQAQNFYSRQKTPHYIINLLTTITTINYVRMCSESYGAQIVNEMNSSEPDIMQRDFTGLDFSAWVHDLFTPDASYTERGIHPSGNGINRYINPNDLTTEEFNYLQKVSVQQLRNLLSPMLWGINSLNILDEPNNSLRINFAVRNILSSFGTSTQTDLLISRNQYKLYAAFHWHKNYVRGFPGVDFELLDFPFTIKEQSLEGSFRLSAWLQPQNQQFKTHTAQAGALCSAKIYIPLNQYWLPFAEIRVKTAGWVVGDVFLSQNLSLQIGMRARLSENIKTRKRAIFSR